MEEISLNAFEKSIVSGMKPKLKKSTLKIEKSDYRIFSITELITKNFNKNKTSDVIGYFVLYVNGKGHEITVDITVIKVLEAVFRTTGRLPGEMKAICFFQSVLINSIAKIRTKKELLTFIEQIESNDKTVTDIKDTLIALCKGVE